MIAVLNIGGQQVKIKEKQELYINKLNGKVGEKITIENISLIEKNKNITVGSPIIKGANVVVSILEHTKDDKIIVFKKKRRKGYKVKNGHRQMITKVKVESISLTSKSTKKIDTEKKDAAKKTTAKKTTAKKTTAKKQ